MKTLSGGLSNHVLGNVTSLCTCFMIQRRDGQQFFFTDLDQDLVIGGDTYLAAVGYQRTDLISDDRLAVDNLEVSGIFDDASITERDVRAGLFDYAIVQIFVVNYEDLTQGAAQLRRGRLGQVSTSRRGVFEAELRGLVQAFSRVIGEVRSPECRADLGDSRCKIPIDPPAVQRSTAYVAAPNPDFVTAGLTNLIHECTTAGTTAASAPSYNPTVGGTTMDGTAVFTTREAWTREAAVATVTDNRIFSITVDEDRDVSGWFDQGLVTWVTGNNAGLSMDVKTWTKTGADAGDVVLFLKMPFDVQVGDDLLIHPGCLKRRDEDCLTKFENVVNFRGEPDLPGRDEALRIFT